MPISGTKNEPSGHSKVLLREQQTDQQMWKHFPVHCQILKRANVQLFQRRKQNLKNFLFTLQKLHGCTLIFLYLLFGSKNREIDQTVIVLEWLACDLIRHNFSNMGTFPRTPCTQ